MEQEHFKELMNLLKKIEAKFDLLIRLTKTAAPPPKITNEERKILNLCNQKHSIDAMIEKTGKTRNNVRVILTSLRNKGMIKTTTVKGKRVYRRVG